MYAVQELFDERFEDFTVQEKGKIQNGVETTSDG